MNSLPFSCSTAVSHQGRDNNLGKIVLNDWCRPISTKWLRKGCPQSRTLLFQVHSMHFIILRPVTVWLGQKSSTPCHEDGKDQESALHCWRWENHNLAIVTVINNNIVLQMPKLIVRLLQSILWVKAQGMFLWCKILWLQTVLIMIRHQVRWVDLVSWLFSESFWLLDITQHLVCIHCWLVDTIL